MAAMCNLPYVAALDYLAFARETWKKYEKDIRIYERMWNWKNIVKGTIQ